MSDDIYQPIFDAFSEYEYKICSSIHHSRVTIIRFDVLGKCVEIRHEHPNKSFDVSVHFGPCSSNNIEPHIAVEWAGNLDGVRYYDDLDDCGTIEDVIKLKADIIKRHLLKYLSDDSMFERLLIYKEGFRDSYNYYHR